MCAGDQRRGDPKMPTNLPDPQERKEQESRDKFLSVILVFLRIALVIAIAMVVWLWWAR
jgi:hypothetical protein